MTDRPIPISQLPSPGDAPALEPSEDDLVPVSIWNPDKFSPGVGGYDTRKISAAALAAIGIGRIPQNTILGSVSPGLTRPVPLTPTQVTALLNIFTPTLKGLVPPGGSASTFLRGDATWAAATATGFVIGPPSSIDGNVALFDGGSGTVIRDSGTKIKRIVQPIPNPAFPAPGQPEFFRNTLNFYIAPDGIDSGVHNPEDKSTPFKTRQRAYEYLLGNFDLNGAFVNFWHAAGIYPDGCTLYDRPDGMLFHDQIKFLGDVFTPDEQGVCLAQSVAASGTFVINGTYAVSGVVDSPSWRIPRRVSITSPNNDSLTVFVIIGLNFAGGSINESIAGPNIGTVVTNTSFAKITSVSVNAAVTGVKVGLEENDPPSACTIQPKTSDRPSTASADYCFGLQQGAWIMADGFVFDMSEAEPQGETDPEKIITNNDIIAISNSKLVLGTNVFGYNILRHDIQPSYNSEVYPFKHYYVIRPFETFEGLNLGTKYGTQHGVPEFEGKPFIDIPIVIPPANVIPYKPRLGMGLLFGGGHAHLVQPGTTVIGIRIGGGFWRVYLSRPLNPAFATGTSPEGDPTFNHVVSNAFLTCGVLTHFGCDPGAFLYNGTSDQGFISLPCFSSGSTIYHGGVFSADHTRVYLTRHLFADLNTSRIRHCKYIKGSNEVEVNDLTGLAVGHLIFHSAIPMDFNDPTRVGSIQTTPKKSVFAVKGPVGAPVPVLATVSEMSPNVDVNTANPIKDFDLPPIEPYPGYKISGHGMTVFGFQADMHGSPFSGFGGSAIDLRDGQSTTNDPLFCGGDKVKNIIVPELKMGDNRIKVSAADSVRIWEYMVIGSLGGQRPGLVVYGGIDAKGRLRIAPGTVIPTFEHVSRFTGDIIISKPIPLRTDNAGLPEADRFNVNMSAGGNIWNSSFAAVQEVPDITAGTSEIVTDSFQREVGNPSFPPPVSPTGVERRTLGFRPRALMSASAAAEGGDHGLSVNGLCDANLAQFCTARIADSVPNNTWNNSLWYVADAAGSAYYATVTSFNDDGYTLQWTRIVNVTPISGLYRFFVLCLR